MTRSHYTLRLYVAGSSSRSTRAIVNAKAICDGFLKGFYDLEVIDLFQHPHRAREDQIVALPTLVRRAPVPLRRIVGDLADEDSVLSALGVDRSEP